MTSLLRLSTVLLMILIAPCVGRGEGEALLNKLLAPGPLIDAHKELERADCLKCHDAGKGVPNSKCLECHKEIAKSVQTRRGFHGLMDASCTTCHRDHKGRDYNSVEVDTKTFDHNKTGFALEGQHAGLKCTDCHLDKRKQGGTRYLGKTSTCASCHKKDDVHFFKGDWAQKDCSSCHKATSWKEQTSFNHARDTGYNLQGKHQELKCSECHKADPASKTVRYHWDHLSKKQCASCHDDIHKNNLSGKFRGGTCAKCHNEESWKIEKFKHSVTGFALQNKHAALECKECHRQKNASLQLKHYNWTGLNSQCLTCHQNYHLFNKNTLKGVGQLNNCLTCHSDTGWKQTHTFDHSKNTRYPLTGRHLDLTCTECHIKKAKNDKGQVVQTAQYHWAHLSAKTCETCHKSPHVGTFSRNFANKKCTECHVTDGWKLDKNQKNFNHGQTRFPLTGKHTALACASCHTVNGKTVYSFASADQQFCSSCHTNQHKGQFDQNFASRSCVECHTTDRFDKQKPIDHDATRFKLRGAHVRTQCLECHVDTQERFNTKTANVKHQFVFPDLPAKACLSCHEDYHKGQLGNTCTKCHSEQSWKKPQFDHNRESRFSLKGRHAELQCTQCHQPARGQFADFGGERHQVVRYKPMPTQCAQCHKDPHNGNLGKRCNECHTEKTWKQTRNFHTNFTLHGTHYTASCGECHKENRKLSGLSEQCIVCHQKDDVHSGSLPDCTSCHRQTFWEHTKFRHSMSFFPLRGIHRTLACGDCHQQGVYRGLGSQCIDCHRSNALQAVSPSHTFPAFQDCQRCHNQFSFGR